MPITSLQQAITLQIEINRFLASMGLKDLVGGYGQLLVISALGGTTMPATNRGFDVRHSRYKRIEVKTRKYEGRLDGGVREENRAVGFRGKEGGFDWLAHIVLDTQYRVVAGTLAKYSEIWPEIVRTGGKVRFQTSSAFPSSVDITEKLRQAEQRLGVGALR